jgi:hypothetical protein
LNSANKIEFISKECKNQIHHICPRLWYGLGLEVVCKCECGHTKVEVLERHVERLACSNTSSQDPPSQKHGVAIK